MMHRLKHIWFNCKTCGSSNVYTAYTVHNRFFRCSCGDYVMKKVAYSERMISHPEITSLNVRFESFAIAWGA